MRSPTWALLLASSALVSADVTTDKQTAASWEESGTCAYYFDNFGKQSPLTETCVKYCEGQNDHGYAQCDVAAYKDIDIPNENSLSILKDEDGDSFVPCSCICENADAEKLIQELLDTVIKGLEKLDEVICAVTVETFKTIAEVGMDFIPGTIELKAAARLVKGAKSFVENGLDAASYFDNWVGKACGIPEWNFDITDMFGDLSGAPNSLGTSIGCKKKNKSSCKKMDPVPDPPKSKKPEKPSQTDKEPPKEDAPPASKSPDKPASKSSSSPAPTSSGSDSCKRDSGCRDTTPCSIKYPDKGGDLEGAVDLIGLFQRDISPASQNRSPRRALLEDRSIEKRTDRKSGKPCSKSPGNEKFVLQSDPFDQNGELDDNVDSYGYSKQNDYCDWSWQGGTVQIKGNKYHSEHVMEWQTVTDFWAKMQIKFGTTQFDSPDPSNPGQVDFCTYWINSWGRDDKAIKFSIDNGPDLTPWQHIARAYPSTKVHQQEMIRLQSNINAPAKANLFTDTIPFIWNLKTMLTYTKTNRNKVLERMRLLIGARTYLLSPKVSTIFKDQKERMGEIIDKLDSEMENHPYVGTDAAGNPVTYKAWKKQGLLDEWNKHMDKKWDDATAKFKKTIDKFGKELKKVHCEKKKGKKMSKGDKEFCGRLVEVSRQYNGVSTFARPW
ncbi:unnamed protein product [Periconia digitata]|uniref:Uncharacterized protein n=1 Tax=Periconia digitata TaxID=1303443 RepID=A0A9W4UAC9_9PLEO|nr:unnamed protein product [Periconia digitata]